MAFSEAIRYAVGPRGDVMLSSHNRGKVGMPETAPCFLMSCRRVRACDNRCKRLHSRLRSPAAYCSLILLLTRPLLLVYTSNRERIRRFSSDARQAEGNAQKIPCGGRGLMLSSRHADSTLMLMSNHGGEDFNHKNQAELYAISQIPARSSSRGG